MTTDRIDNALERVRAAGGKLSIFIDGEGFDLSARNAEGLAMELEAYTENFISHGYGE